MDPEIVRRLDRQDRVLAAILAALAPPEAEETETETSGFNDLLDILSDLTAAVSDVKAAVQVLRSGGSAHFPPAGP